MKKSELRVLIREEIKRVILESGDSTMTIDKKIDARVWRNAAGKLHREDGPAVEYSDGGKEWRLNGRYHREGGPAIEWVNGDKSWYLNGKRHREDGPAVDYVSGHKEWWLNGEQLTEKEFNIKTMKR
jgi:hypothetical protein